MYAGDKHIRKRPPVITQKAGKAAGPDGLKPLLLREVGEEIVPILKIIYERSIQTGKLPADWTKANVMLEFKKGDKSLASNYRPIILCKVLEHILASNIVKHLDEQGLMYDLLHGFRERRSCETQLIMLIEDLASKGRQTDIILLDLSKAFDKVSQRKLIWKLHQYGIRGHVLSWIGAFLGSRSQRVEPSAHTILFKFKQQQTTTFFPIAIVQWNTLLTSAVLSEVLTTFRPAICSLNHIMPSTHDMLILSAFN